MKNDSLLSFEEKLVTTLQTKKASSEWTQGLKTQLDKSLLSKTIFLDNHKKNKGLRWAFAGFCLALIAVVTVLAIGPQKVWAEITSLFQRLPGVGVVGDISDSCVLTEPIILEQDGYTMTLEELSSTPQKGWVRFSLDGWQGDQDFFYMMLREFGSLQYTLDDFKPSSVKVGDIYESQKLYLEYNLPSVCNATHFTLDFDNLPGSKKNMAPAIWQFEPQLRAATKEDTLPQKNKTFISSNEQEGISLQILSFFETEEETMLSYRFHTPSLRNSVSVMSELEPSNPIIVDSAGQQYYEKDRTAAGHWQHGYFSILNKLPHNETFHLSSPFLILEWESADFNQMEAESPISLEFSPDIEDGHVWNLDFWHEYDYPHKVYFEKVVYHQTPYERLEVHYGAENDDIWDLMLYCFGEAAPSCNGVSSNKGFTEITLAEKPIGELILGLYRISRDIRPDGGWFIDFSLNDLPKAEWLPGNTVPYIEPEPRH